MTIDSRYIASSDLELYLVDKTTGLPLANGTVEFFSDVNRSVHKAVYTISGVAPNYTFVQLPNPSTLSGTGTFQDAGNNNVIPYYFPYDPDGNIELYYIVIKDQNDVVQFTREAWPPNVGVTSTTVEANAVNYIPNGQFLSHTDIPADVANNIPFGQIRSPVTNIAQGGWSFERPIGSIAIDNVQFFEYGEFVVAPTASPRYAVQIICSSPDSTDTFKNLAVRFYDVNKFASDTNEYTFGFSGNTFNSGDFNVTLKLIKNYGTGGSPSPTEISNIESFLIESAETAYQTSFIFGNNSGTSIGTNNDDYIELVISLPTNVAFGIQLTDFILYFGNIEIIEFPPTTNADFISRSLTAPPPNPNGSDYYLPLIATPIGMSYDNSSVGNIIATQDNFSGSIHPTSNLLKLDGSQYLTSGYSALGIPFSRLQKTYYLDTINQPEFGTGMNFVTSYIQQSSSSDLFMCTNSFGLSVAPADGINATGFTFFPINTYSPSGFGLNGYQTSASQIFLKSTVSGLVTNPTAGTSGFTINVYRNDSQAFLMFYILTIAATTLAGKYFTFFTYPGPSLGTSYYMWFTVDGVGVDPAPGGTGIHVNLKSTYTSADVATIVSNVLSGRQANVITTVGAGSLTPADYFTFGTTNAGNYFVWYTIDGIGSKPIVLGSFGIQVDLVSGDLSADVANKTMIAINKTYFAVPDLSGMTLRGFDPNNEWDLGPRFSQIPLLFGNTLGSFEVDDIISHSHTYVEAVGPVQKPLASGSNSFTLQNSTSTSLTGGHETKVANINVVWLVRY